MQPILIDMLKKNLRSLRLTDMARNLDAVLEAAEREQQGHLQFLSQLVQKQLEAAENRSLERRLRMADFPRLMTFDNFDWNFQPGLNVPYLKNLQTLTFIASRQPVLIFGKTGCGKTHIAVALGVTACAAGYRVRFFTLQKLLAHLYATLADDTTAEAIATLARCDMLIIDHVGFIRTKAEYPSLLLDLICACQHRVAITVTSSLSIAEWGQALGSPAITGDIVDRLFDGASILRITQGLSYRTHGPHAQRAPTLAQQLDDC